MPYPESYTKFDLYSKALRIRMIEEAIAAKYKEQEMRCPTHLSIGQEANAVAISLQLTKDDYMVSTHRGHAHYLAKGGSLDGLIGELYGRSSGYALGNGGSMHSVDTSCGFLGSTSIVGGTVPVGVGAAFAAKLKKEKKISVVCIGDAAIEEGVFHESANFAALHSLPVVFFMENNNYSCFTPRNKRQPERVNGFKSVAQAHGLDYMRIYWDKFYAGVTMLDLSIQVMRSSDSPSPLFVECDAYRFVEHCGPNSDDNLNYRPIEEQEKFKSLDPIKTLEAELRLSLFMSEEMHLKLVDKISTEITASFDRVRNSEPPDKNELGRYLYA